jgi:chaperonin GroES
MIKPIRSQVLIKLFEGDDMSAGGIVVAESYRAESNKGTVVAAGKGTKVKPMQFKEGDIVFRVQGHGIPVDENGEKYYLMEQGTILAIA